MCVGCPRFWERHTYNKLPGFRRGGLQILKMKGGSSLMFFIPCFEGFSMSLINNSKIPLKISLGRTSRLTWQWGFHGFPVSLCPHSLHICLPSSDQDCRQQQRPCNEPNGHDRRARAVFLFAKPITRKITASALNKKTSMTRSSCHIIMPSVRSSCASQDLFHHPGDKL